MIGDEGRSEPVVLPTDMEVSGFNVKSSQLAAVREYENVFAIVEGVALVNAEEFNMVVGIKLVALAYQFPPTWTRIFTLAVVLPVLADPITQLMVETFERLSPVVRIASGPTGWVEAMLTERNPVGEAGLPARLVMNTCAVSLTLVVALAEMYSLQETVERV